LLRKNRKVGLSAFKCDQIVQIRNNLIEHPEGLNLYILGWSWKDEDGRGPVLNAERPSKIHVIDDGLFRNADKMRMRLETRFAARCVRGNGVGQIRKRGGVYWIRFDRNGERLEESARTDKWEAARDLLKSREGDVPDGRPVSPKAGRLRFEDAAADLVTEYTVNGRRTLKHLQRRLKLHLTPWFGGRRLVDIGTADVRALTAARLEAKAAPGEINRELAALKRLFRLAKQAGRFVGDVPHVPMLQEHNVRRGFFERAQFDTVKGDLPAALRGVLEFAYLTGWRLTSEILPLEWRQVDWTGRVVRLDPGTTKNGEGRSFPFTAAQRADAPRRRRFLHRICHFTAAPDYVPQRPTARRNAQAADHPHTALGHISGTSSRPRILFIEALGGGRPRNDDCEMCNIERIPRR
jgi:integrase